MKLCSVQAVLGVLPTNGAAERVWLVSWDSDLRQEAIAANAWDPKLEATWPLNGVEARWVTGLDIWR